MKSMDTNHSRRRLTELHGSGYEIADGQPNIIGWKIRDINNHRVGVVEDLLFDEEQQKVRYIIANLKDNFFDLDKRKVLIPIGIAELHESDDDVIIPSVSAWQLRALPTYQPNISDRDEQEVYTVFSMPSTYGTVLENSWKKPVNFYEHSSFNNENLYKKRSAPSNYTPSTRTEETQLAEHNRSLQDHEALAAGDRQSFATDQSMRQELSSDNEKLISRIKRMQAELGEIERDLRNDRLGR